MRKLLALLFVAAAFTFTACGNKSETSHADSAAADTAAAPDPIPADTATMAPADSSSMAPADSAK